MMFLPAFTFYPNEGMLIGKMVVGYGELEFGVMQCLVVCVGERITAVRLLYRVRSETSRLDIADALLRPYFAKYKLSAEYDEAWNALKFCKTIRNKYAHSHWAFSAEEGLFFTDFETPAESREGHGSMIFSHTDEPLLQRQLEYFEYCDKILVYLEEELRKRNGQQSENSYSMPPKLNRPPLYILLETASPIPRSARTLRVLSLFCHGSPQFSGQAREQASAGMTDV